ncbi:hypothetical protein BDV96DRAFT_646247 [Lophiotrema nucula]|uniref:Uncharacterized protein n=1 Tax=Lophiotrema nucula TaxID=690887 RepID=A0A6A5Z9Y1_9PLEO|nr:hypothetical protein BDV96DRAFT_646247 [Lophiotrema nucula]
MLSKSLSFALIATTAYANPLENRAAAACIPCNPQGATGLNPPDVGSDLKSLYVDMLDSVKDIHFEKRWSGSSPIVGKREDSLCCRDTLDCVNVENFNIPMCYDKFTTNFAFADGTAGSLTSGEYNDTDGSTANLLTGDYTSANGQTGNIYSDDAAAKPNTATLSIPPQWTGTGLGTPIPATEIASYGPVATTGTLPGTASSNPTTTGSASQSQNTAASSSPKSSGAAGQNPLDSTKSLGVSVMSALLYLIYVL